MLWNAPLNWKAIAAIGTATVGLFAMTDGWVVAWCAVATLLLMVLIMVWRWFKGIIRNAELRGAKMAEEAAEKKKTVNLLTRLGQRFDSQTTDLTQKIEAAKGELKTIAGGVATDLAQEKESNKTWRAEVKADLAGVKGRLTEIEQNTK